MTQKEWENASDEERKSEYERCRTDSHYLYMTYYWKEGMKTYTKDEWDLIQGFSIVSTRRIRRFNPLVEAAKSIYKLPDFTKPTERSYDGKAMRINWECDPEEPFPIPISLALSDPEKYAELVEKRKEIMNSWWDIAKPELLDVKQRIRFTSPFDNDMENRVFKMMWEANQNPNTTVKTEWASEEESKEAFQISKRLNRYFLPPYKNSLDKWGNEK